MLTRLIVLAALLSVACGRSSLFDEEMDSKDAGAPTSDSPDDAAPSDDGGSLESSAGDSGTSGCLSPPPAENGAPCALGSICEFGTSPFYDCDSYAGCNDGLSYFMPGVDSLCAAETSVCAADTPVAGASCSQAAVMIPGCDTPAGTTCYCYAVQTTATWQCSPHGPGCPVVRPHLGWPCAPWDAGQQCEYAVGVEECTATGVWILRENP